MGQRVGIVGGIDCSFFHKGSGIVLQSSRGENDEVGSLAEKNEADDGIGLTSSEEAIDTGGNEDPDGDGDKNFHKLERSGDVKVAEVVEGEAEDGEHHSQVKKERGAEVEVATVEPKTGEKGLSREQGEEGGEAGNDQS